VLSLTLEYHAPGCKELVAIFDGRHGAGSPWYEYWCIDPGFLLSSCSNEFLNSTIIDSGTDRIPLSGSDGTVTIATHGGSFPPMTLSSEPSLEGFRLCHISITIDDGIHEGGGPDATMTLGDGCR
jgi:hypothetical protein